MATQLDELTAYFPYGRTIVLAKIGDGLEVWRQPTGEPNQFKIGLCFAF